jgi:hypothetical protein
LNPDGRQRQSVSTPSSPGYKLTYFPGFSHNAT